MKTNLFLIWAVTVMMMPAFAGELSGRVSMSSKSASAEEMHLLLENKFDKFETTTDSGGIFYFLRVPEGKYTLQIFTSDHGFLIRKVKVYQAYNSWLNIDIPETSDTAYTVTIKNTEPFINPIEPNNDKPFSRNQSGTGTETLSNFLSMQAGVDVVNGKICIRGSDQVKIFIDGTPILGKPVLTDTW